MKNGNRNSPREVTIPNNPFDELPPILRKAARILARAAAKDEFPEINREFVSVAAAKRAIREVLSLCPKSIALRVGRDEETKVLHAVVWALTVRSLRVRLSKQPGVVEGITVLGKRYFLSLKEEDLPKGIVTGWDSEGDPYGTPDSYMNREKAHHRIGKTVHQWWDRCTEISGLKAPEIWVRFAFSRRITGREVVWIALSQYDSSSKSISLFCDELNEPVEAGFVWVLDMNWGAFRRMKKYRVRAFPGHLPVDVIEDDDGNPGRIIAFVSYESGEWFLRSVPIEKWRQDEAYFA